MKKEKKTLLLTIILSVMVCSCLLFYYQEILGNARSLYGPGSNLKQTYTTAEIVDLIKQQANYLGDSLTVFEDGSIKSNFPSFQGTIDHVSQNPADNKEVVAQMKAFRLPKPVVVYNLAAHFYLLEHPEVRARLKQSVIRDSTAL